MEDYTSHYDDEDDDESLLGALRSIGAAGARGATLNPLAGSRVGVGRRTDNLSASGVFDNDGGGSGDSDKEADEPSLGEDNFDVLQRARKADSAQRRYDELRREHQVDLNDAKQLADLEDPGLVAHMDRARKQLANHERNQAALPSEESLRRGDTDARRALSSLMTSLKTQQMALQVACDDVLLQATNAQKLADGGQPHGYPAADDLSPQEHAAKSFEYLGKKVSAAGNDLAQIVTALEGFERELTLARRAYENAVDGLARRGQYFEEAYGEAAFLAGREGPRK
jgi:hypothetical protein